MAPKPKLSKEQKKALKLQNQILKFREEKRKEIERTITEQAKKKREIDRSLREMVLEIKIPLMLKDIQAIHHQFIRAHDKKQCYIIHLLKLLDQAEVQYFRNFVNFCDRMDCIIDKFHSDLQNLNALNKRRTEELLQRAKMEGDYNVLRDSNAETHLQLMMYQSKKDATDFIWEKSGKFWVEEKNYRINYLDIIDNLYSFLEKIMSDIWEELVSLIKKYNENTAQNKKQIRILKSKEVRMVNIIQKQALNLERSNEILHKLQMDLAAYESGSKQTYFRDRRDRYREAHSKMVHYILESNNFDKHHLTFLLQNSDEALNWLKAAHKKVEKIHRVAILCRRFETAREKVLPFAFNETPVTIENKKTPLVPEALNSTVGMEGLWYRLSRADLVKRALKREKRMLQMNIKAMTQRLQSQGRGETINPVESKQSIKSYTSECLCSHNLSVLDLLFPSLHIRNK